MSAEWQFLVTLNERLRPLRDPVRIQEAAIGLMREHLQVSRVGYALIDGDDFVIIRSCYDGVPPVAGRTPLAIFGTTVIDACRRGETVVVNDVANDPRFTSAERDALLARLTGSFISAQLIKDGRWLASFGVHDVTPRVWKNEQIALIEISAERMWGFAERARAEEALGQSESRQAFLRRLNDTIRPLADPARILAETCRLIGTHLHANRVTYGEIDGDDCTIVDDYVDGLPSQAGSFRWRDLGDSRVADILRGGTLVANDTSIHPHTLEERAALQAAGIGAYICPLLVKDGRFVGSFGIHSRTPRVWTLDEIALAQEVADRIWTTLEHRKAEAELHTNEVRLAFLLRLNDALRPLGDPAAVQDTAARLLADHLAVNRVGYAERDGHEFVIRHEHTRRGAPLVGQPAQVTIGPMLRDALSRGEAIFVNDVETDPRLGDADRASLKARQIATFVSTALFKDGRMVAAFGANQDTPRVWTWQDVELVRDVAARTWDAVERTRAEAALREQGQRLRLALEASKGGSWTWVAATNHVDWDDRWRELYGFGAGEPSTPDAWMPRVHEEDRPRLVDSLNEILTSPTKGSWENTFRIVMPDGGIRWVQSRGRAERDAAGRLVRMSGLDFDFTQHQRAEEALQARRDEEHDRALRTLLETATQGIVSMDVQGVIVTANRAFEAMFGWPHGELVGQPIERLIATPFRDRQAPQPNLHLVGMRKDGLTFPIEGSLNHVPAPGGGRIFAFVTDITDRQRAAFALQARTDELERRTTQLSQMASDLTLAEQHAREQISKTLHDGLQQLLVIVALNLEQQLKREKESGAVPSELLSEAKHQLDEAIAAARSLNFELFPPALQRAGLPAALRWLASWIRDKYKLDVQVHVDPRADSARKDVRTLLFESVRELLFNAVKHSEADVVHLELELDDQDQLCISVIDEGVGFDPAKLDDRSKTGKAGWGLFSIRERLTLLGGHFVIDSAPGEGTQVSLVAPRGMPQEADPGAAIPDLAPIGSTPAGGNHIASPDALRILIVDDHATVRRALREILHERPQLSVVGDASNGYEAVAHAITLRPDVVLMDVAMPHLDGIEATARIRSELPDTEILGLSMHPRSHVAQAIELAGASRFFVKGVDTQRLIDHLLDVHASRVNAAESRPPATRASH